jgi:hypothetical protein
MAKWMLADDAWGVRLRARFAIGIRRGRESREGRRRAEKMSGLM